MGMGSIRLHPPLSWRPPRAKGQIAIRMAKSPRERWDTQERDSRLMRENANAEEAAAA
jgi:hypothetical protein